MTLLDHRFAEEIPLAPHEQGDVLMFDASGALVHRMAFAGASDHVVPPWRDIVHQALARDCAALLLRHSHMSGDPRPSAADIVTTRLLCRILRPLQLRLADHVIMAGPHRFSFRENGLL